MHAPWKKSYEKRRDITLLIADKGLYSQSYGFSCRHVWMWELDHKESWALKNWCFWNVVLEKTLENPLDCKEIKPVNPKENQPWIFILRTDAEAETPTLQSPAAASKSLHSCPTLCDPIDGSPPGPAIPGILQARTLEWVAISFSNEKPNRSF